MIRTTKFLRILPRRVLIRPIFVRKYQIFNYQHYNTFYEFPKQFIRLNSDFPPHKVAKLPNLSPTMEAGNIQSWQKKEGDKLEDGDTLCQVETDKAVMAMETPYSGYLAKIIHPDGSKNIKIGEPIAIIVKNSSDIEKFKNYKMAENSKTEIPKASIPKMETQKIEMSKNEISKDKIAKPQMSNLGDRKLVSPYAKMIAQQSNIDLTNIIGTGLQGRIVSSDLISKTKISNVATSNYKDIEITSMRATIAKRLLASHSNIPVFYVSIEVNMDGVMALREQINKDMAGNVKLSINDFLIKASSLALLKVPECNSQWHDDYIRQFSITDISVAVSTDSGLITPIIFDASSKSLSKISYEMKELANKAKNNALTLNEFQGGTFTVSNLGMFNVSQFTAIINPPQSCILSVGGVSKQYRYKKGEEKPTFQNIMTATLGCDHRVVDGAVGATWLKTFKEILENPYSILI